MTWAELRRWAEGRGIQLPSQANRNVVSVLGRGPVGGGVRREYGDKDCRRLVAYDRLKKLLGVVRKEGKSKLRLEAIRLAGEHADGHIVISDGKVDWYPEPAPTEWTGLLAKGATVIPGECNE